MKGKGKKGSRHACPTNSIFAKEQHRSKKGEALLMSSAGAERKGEGEKGRATIGGEQGGPYIVN